MMARIDVDRTSTELTHGGGRAFALHCALVMLGSLMGAICFLPGWPLGGEPSKVNIHVLFGLLLCGLVGVRFGWWLQHCRPRGTLDIRRFSRELSRMVYLILYLVIGAQQIIRIIGYLQEDHHTTRGADLLGPPLDGQAFFLCGLSALVLIRVLAFWSWRRLSSRS
jgi:cytochrome b561